MTAFALRLRPLISKLSARMVPRDLDRLASDVTEVAPASPAFLPPAMSLPGMFGRVRGFDQTTNAEIQERYTFSPIDPNGPTRVYTLRNALVLPEGVFFAGGTIPLREGQRRLVVRGMTRVEDEGMLCTSWAGEKYFGHWLRDGLQAELLAKQMNLRPVVLPPRPWLHEEGYRNLAGLDPVPVQPPTLFKQLRVVDDLPLNANRRDRARALREKIRSSVPKNGPERVFVRRGIIGSSRRLVNEQEVISRLANEGFAICDPELLPSGELVRNLASARIVVGVEGSAMTHTQVSVGSGAVLVTIQPPMRFNALARCYAAALGQKYAFTVADPHPEGFVQDIDELLATLDMAEAALAD